jgi:outer membrane receptor protein involved in Fe transport
MEAGRHAFVDDTWKLTPKLTLSLGLRYELTPPFTDTLGDYFTVGALKVGFTANGPQSDWPYFVRQDNCRYFPIKSKCRGCL